MVIFSRQHRHWFWKSRPGSPHPNEWFSTGGRVGSSRLPTVIEKKIEKKKASGITVTSFLYVVKGQLKRAMAGPHRTRLIFAVGKLL
jgi:hypothetical protein